MKAISVSDFRLVSYVKSSVSNLDSDDFSPRSANADSLILLLNRYSIKGNHRRSFIINNFRWNLKHPPAEPLPPAALVPPPPKCKTTNWSFHYYQTKTTSLKRSTLRGSNAHKKWAALSQKEASAEEVARIWMMPMLPLSKTMVSTTSWTHEPSPTS